MKDKIINLISEHLKPYISPGGEPCIDGILPLADELVKLVEDKECTHPYWAVWSKCRYEKSTKCGKVLDVG